MGLFDLLGSVTKAVVKTAVLPVDIVRDVVDIDGAESYTEDRVESISDDAEDALDELFDLFD